jgi:hypothetical protein
VPLISVYLILARNLGRVVKGKVLSGQSPALLLVIICVQLFENGRRAQPLSPFREGGRVIADSKIQIHSSRIPFMAGQSKIFPRAARQPTTSHYAGKQSLLSNLCGGHRKFCDIAHASFQKMV